MIGFAVVHAMFFLALLPTMIAGQTQGDLPLYRLWAEQAKLGYWPVIDMPWVYPAAPSPPSWARSPPGPTTTSSAGSCS
jgi:hypothetical protein